MNVAHFRLAITPEEYMQYYQGYVQNVVVRAFDGRRVAFPAGRLRSFITPTGIYGLFALRFDSQNKFLSLERIGD